MWAGQGHHWSGKAYQTRFEDLSNQKPGKKLVLFASTLVRHTIREPSIYQSVVYFKLAASASPIACRRPGRGFPQKTSYAGRARIKQRRIARANRHQRKLIKCDGAFSCVRMSSEMLSRFIIIPLVTNGGHAFATLNKAGLQ